MNLNSAIYTLYSIPESIIEYKEEIKIYSDHLYHKELYDDSIYIDIPDIKEIFIISNIVVHKGNYEIIADKNILGSIPIILFQKYKKVSIRLYNIKEYKSLKISFNVTLAKKIRSFL